MASSSGMTAMRPFTGCLVRVIDPNSRYKNHVGGVVRMTSDGDYVVSFNGRESVFREDQLSTAVKFKRPVASEPDSPTHFLDKWGQRVFVDDVVVYARDKSMMVGLVRRLVYYQGRPAVQAVTHDGQNVKWSLSDAMMRIDRSVLPAKAYAMIMSQECADDPSHGDVES